MLEGDASTGDFSQDLFRGGSPYEWFWVVIVDFQVVFDRSDELVDAVEHATPDSFVGDLSEPPFHKVEPR